MATLTSFQSKPAHFSGHVYSSIMSPLQSLNMQAMWQSAFVEFKEKHANDGTGIIDILNGKRAPYS